VAAAALLLLRPLSFSDVVWVAVLAVVALLVVLLVERPPKLVAVTGTPSALEAV
jgi:hypothetical protein